MRTKSIISVIRKYGLSSKRLSPKSRIKYEDAIKGLKGYQNSELEIIDVVDNYMFPARSRSTVCQVKGCGKSIRYEYTLRNKIDNLTIVAGSTCVWVMLGLSDLEIKSFKGLEEAIKEYHALYAWREANPDVCEKLNSMKDAGLMKFRPFWREVENCRLLDEDTDYIRSIDVEKLLRSKEEEKALEDARKQKMEEQLKASEPERLAEKEAYDKVLEALDVLLEKNPHNDFFNSLKAQSKGRWGLSLKQIRAIKLNTNKAWYEDTIKGTVKDCWKDCERMVVPFIKGIIISKKMEVSDYEMDAIKAGDDNQIPVICMRHLKDLNKLFKEDMTLAGGVKLAWNVYKVKYSLVV